MIPSTTASAIPKRTQFEVLLPRNLYPMAATTAYVSAVVAANKGNVTRGAAFATLLEKKNPISDVPRALRIINGRTDEMPSVMQRTREIDSSASLAVAKNKAGIVANRLTIEVTRKYSVPVSRADGFVPLLTAAA